MTAAAAAFVFGGTIAAAVSPIEVTGYLAGTTAADVSTAACIAAGAGGVAPYTYAWAQVGTAPYTWTIDNPASDTTGFTAQSLPLGACSIAQFRVIITDANGATGSADVTAGVCNNTPYGPF